MDEHYLAFDLGAESGRVFLGTLHDHGSLEINELHRFPNNMLKAGEHLYWDIPRLYEEILHGLKVSAANPYQLPISIGIDTWGVDFALLDKQGKLLRNPSAYRDKQRHDAMAPFLARISGERLFQLTGIQLIPINSVFQLYALVLEGNSQLTNAKDLLFIPDLFNYFLSGVKASEFTTATTSQLYNPLTGRWDAEIFTRLNVSGRIMQKIVSPGTILGNLTPDIARRIGLDEVTVVATASHDTAAAIAAVPARDKDFVYISSGTWSCMGIESPSPIINERTLKYNISNEGGACETFLHLKNIMGLWILQECKREWSAAREYTYSELIGLAENIGPFETIIDPDSPKFMNPPSMTLAITEYCRATGQPVPQDTGHFVYVILQSLALAYRYVLEQLAEINERAINRIHIIGGGSQDQLLCQLTTDITGLPVYAGPAEATATGNILVQAMAFNRVSSLEELREIVRRSFRLNQYNPRNFPNRESLYRHFADLKKQKNV